MIPADDSTWQLFSPWQRNRRKEHVAKYSKISGTTVKQIEEKIYWIEKWKFGCEKSQYKMCLFFYDRNTSQFKFCVLFLLFTWLFKFLFAQTVQISIYVFILCICYVIYFENLKYNLVYVRTSRWRKIAGSAWLLLFTWANHVNSGITGWKIRYYSALNSTHYMIICQWFNVHSRTVVLISEIVIYANGYSLRLLNVFTLRATSHSEKIPTQSNNWRLDHMSFDKP